MNLIFCVCAANTVANLLFLPPIILDPDLTLHEAQKRARFGKKFHSQFEVTKYFLSVKQEGNTVVTKAKLKKK